MAQRIKPADKADAAAYSRYVRQLTLSHEMLITGMKCKQTTDLENVKKLRQLLADFEAALLDKEASPAPEKPHKN